MRKGIVVGLAVVALVACGDDDVGMMMNPDAGRDGGRGDSSIPDTGLPDRPMPPPDTTMPDGMLPDTAMPDGMTPDPCMGVSNCTMAGVTCMGNELVSCAADMNGCLVETRTNCAMMNATCGSDAMGTMCRSRSMCPAAGDRLLTCGATAMGDTAMGSDVIDNYTCSSFLSEVGREVVWAFEAPADQHVTVNFRAGRGRGDFDLYVIDGTDAQTCTAMSPCVRHNADGNSSGTVSFDYRAGTRLFVSFDRYQSQTSTSDVTLQVSCAPRILCGNGMLDPGEECDDMNAARGDGCSPFCRTETGFACERGRCAMPACGNGVSDSSESCDDGDTMAGDGCDADCNIEEGYECDTSAQPDRCASSTCGNGIPGFSSCDDGNTTAGDGCSDTCSTESGYRCTGTPSVCRMLGCGDGYIDFGNKEGCDDGNPTAGDGCSDSCQTETEYTCPTVGMACRRITCGDGLRDGAEACDDANTTAGDGCSATCTVETDWACEDTPSRCFPRCGDGVVSPDTCDDGNQMSGDGCSAMCMVEPMYVCTGEPSTCRIPRCGDGFIDMAETCDDGDAMGGDGCSATCAPEMNYVCTGQPSVCVIPVCGNGMVEPGESCDDNNTTAGDGCSADCIAEIAPIGMSRMFTTALTAASPTWTRPTRSCETDTTDAHYATYTITNAGTAAATVEVRATPMDIDGLIVAYTNPFDPTMPTTRCVAGADQGGTGSADSFTYTVPAGGRLVIVLTSYSELSTTARYEVVVTTRGCGDGVVDAMSMEACDDGDAMSGDGCSATCTVESGYVCSGAPSMCSPIVCGDGRIEGAEVCDDGDAMSGDGCSATCTVESGYICVGTPSACSRPVCGNGAIEAGESCDDNNMTTGDGCSANCAVELAARGMSRTFQTALTMSSPRWGRATPGCGDDGRVVPYATYILENVGATPEMITASATAMGIDGVILAYTFPFDPSMPTAGCLTGGDQGSSGGADMLTTTVPPGGRVVIVITPYFVNETTPQYDLSVRTLQPT